MSYYYKCGLGTEASTSHSNYLEEQTLKSLPLIWILTNPQEIYVHISLRSTGLSLLHGQIPGSIGLCILACALAIPTACSSETRQAALLCHAPLLFSCLFPFACNVIISPTPVHLVNTCYPITHLNLLQCKFKKLFSFCFFLSLHCLSKIHFLFTSSHSF